MICLLCWGTSLPHSGQPAVWSWFQRPTALPWPAPGPPGWLLASSCEACLGNQAWAPPCPLLRKSTGCGAPGAWCTGRKRILEHEFPCPARLTGCLGAFSTPGPEPAEHGHAVTSVIASRPVLHSVWSKGKPSPSPRPALSSAGLLPRAPGLTAGHGPRGCCLPVSWCAGHSCSCHLGGRWDVEWPVGKALCDPRLSP